jgi:hypothetical protein
MAHHPALSHCGATLVVLSFIAASHFDPIRALLEIAANLRAEPNTSVEQDVRELRHGRGFIRGERGIDGEYR